VDKGIAVCTSVAPFFDRRSDPQNASERGRVSIYDNLEFRHLKYIIAVAEEGSFTRAAARLHVAQSAVSTQIAEIESWFNIRIFNRTRAGVTLTNVGETFLPLAIQLLQTREDFVKLMQALQQTSSGPFKLGFTPFVESHVIGTVCRTYRGIFPRGEIHPESGDIEEIVDRLADASIDAALLTLPINAEGLYVHPVLSEPLVVCIRKEDPLAQHEELPPKSLDGRLSIFSDPRRHPMAHARLLELLKEQGIRPHLANPNFNSGHVQWMVREQQCVALIRKGETLHEEVTTRPIQGVRWTIDFALVYRPEHRQMALPLLLRQLERHSTAFGPIAARRPPRSSDQAETQGEFPFGEPRSGFKDKTG
jgi:DNA-binding transcriptional LysR family regulator